MLIDTHVHTRYSDGLDSVEKVIEDAGSGGIGLLSITDHDCVDAYPSAIRLAKARSINIMPGVELTTMNEQGCNCIHVVGLGIDTNAGLRAVLDRITDARDRSDRGFLDNMNGYFAERYPGWKPTQGIKPSVFHNTIRNAAEQGIVIKEKEMMDVILNPELWVPIDYEITLDEAVSYIKEWGGVPVLAHPFDFSNDANVVLDRFLKAGGQAIEVCKYRYKVRTDMLSNLARGELLAKEREMNDWTIKQARKHDLKLTMASDHHDESRVMGMDPEEYGIDVSWLNDLCA